MDRADRGGHVWPCGGKTRTGAALENPVLTTEGHVTFIDGLLALSVLAGLTLNAAVGAWWADPLSGYVIGFYGFKEGYVIFRPPPE